MYLVIVRRYDMSMEYSISFNTKHQAKHAVRYLTSDSTFAFIK